MHGMPPPAGVLSQGDQIPLKPMMVSGVVQQSQSPVFAAAPEAYAKDAIIAWFRGEFAAANAIIDALCGHLKRLEGGETAAYETAFAAIHRRRLNWIPILQMQKYYPIADVALELKKVAEGKEIRRAANVVEAKEIQAAADGDGCAVAVDENEKQKEMKRLESSVESNESGGGELADEDFTSDITDTGSQEVQHSQESIDICSNHDHCDARRAQIKMIKGFVAKEPVKGHMVNVVRGLKLYEDVFTDAELSKLNDFVDELRVAGQNGELSGETFILYNQQTKGNKRELIQLGVPIFGKIKETESKTLHKSYIEPIPALLVDVMEHLIQWRLIPENKKPNSCIISFFDKGEYSQPFLKPPHLEQPLSTLLLHESTMAFGRTLLSHGERDHRGPLMLSLIKGSLLVMKGNSSDVARHAMCSSLNKRTSITFFRVRSEPGNNHHPPPETETASPLSRAITLWQRNVPTPSLVSNVPNDYDNSTMSMVPKWSLLRPPVVMLAPVHAMGMNPKKISRGGTGVFLPWAVGSRKHTKQLPPRAQRSHFLVLPPAAATFRCEVGADPVVGISRIGAMS